ncbi:MAG: amino acid racemase [Alphaproteobacteria bacterium]|nr:amino acid racemase [Alphaproteobacteria bacterium]
MEEMKKIGLIGGTSWTSTVDYYRYINKETGRRLGGLHSAKMAIVSIDFAELEAAMHSDRWSDATAIIADAAGDLNKMGVSVVLLCSNLLHRMHADIEKVSYAPVLHIGDAIAAEIGERGYAKVALLGARPTMEEDFYKARIREKSGAEILIPDAEDRAYIDDAIFKRMCRDIYTDEDRTKICGIIDTLRERGAQAVILGCTELPVLLQEASLPLLNSTQIHSYRAVDEALFLRGGRQPRNARHPQP